MKKTIKMIDLFVIIANNKEVPKKIQYRGSIWEYNSNTNSYYRIEDVINLWEWIEDIDTFIDCLNDEVEIIEEEKNSKYTLNQLSLKQIQEAFKSVSERCGKIFDEMVKMKNDLGINIEAEEDKQMEKIKQSRIDNVNITNIYGTNNDVKMLMNLTNELIDKVNKLESEVNK